MLAENKLVFESLALNLHKTESRNSRSSRGTSHHAQDSVVGNSSICRVHSHYRDAWKINGTTLVSVLDAKEIV